MKKHTQIKSIATLSQHIKDKQTGFYEYKGLVVHVYEPNLSTLQRVTNLYANRRQKGLCAYCGKRKPQQNKKMCIYCRKARDKK